MVKACLFIAVKAKVKGALKGYGARFAPQQKRIPAWNRAAPCFGFWNALRRVTACRDRSLAWQEWIESPFCDTR